MAAKSTEYLLYTRYHIKPFTQNNSFNPYKNAVVIEGVGVGGGEWNCGEGQELNA